MVKKMFFLSLFLLISYAFSNDFDARIIINQSALNKFLEAVGPLTYKGNFSKKSMNLLIDYSWTVQNPSIQIHPEKAVFKADVSIEVGPVKKGSFNILSSPFKYPTTAKGVVEIKYNENSNRISVKVKEVSFEVSVNILGQKVHVTDVDISQFYRPEFEFNGPQPIQKTIETKTPDGKIKTFKIIARPRMILEEGQIVVSTPVNFEIKQ